MIKRQGITSFNRVKSGARLLRLHRLRPAAVLPPHSTEIKCWIRPIGLFQHFLLILLYRFHRGENGGDTTFTALYF